MDGLNVCKYENGWGDWNRIYILFVSFNKCLNTFHANANQYQAIPNQGTGIKANQARYQTKQGIKPSKVSNQATLSHL
jgi:hypothetical protein